MGIWLYRGYVKMACYWGKCGDMAIQRVREDGMLLGKCGDMAIQRVHEDGMLLGKMWGYGYTEGT